MAGPRKRKKKPPPLAEVDERWFGDWFEYGWGDLILFLTDHPTFKAYKRFLIAHPPDPEPEEPALD